MLWIWLVLFSCVGTSAAAGVDVCHLNLQHAMSTKSLALTLVRPRVLELRQVFQDESGATDISCSAHSVVSNEKTDICIIMYYIVF